QATDTSLPVNASSRPDPIHASRLRAFYAAQIPLRSALGRYRFEAAEKGRVASHRFAQPRRAHQVDADTARQFDRRSAHKTFQREINGGRVRAFPDRLLGEDAAGQRKRAAVV